jgi:hypothetical protein
MKKLLTPQIANRISQIAFCLLLSVFCLLPSVSFAQKQQRIEVQTKVFTKNFKVNPKDQLVVDTKYTEVTFIEWDKNEVDFTTTITLNNVTEKDMERVLDGFTLNNKQTGDKITYSSTLSYYCDKKSKGVSHKLDINLLVKIPKDIFVEITSSFGDVDFQTLYNDFKADVSYADLNVEKLLGENNTIKIRFGKIKLEQAKNISLDIQYSDGIIKETTGTLALNSRFNTIKIDKAHYIDLSSGYDNITIRGNLDKIEGKMEFGKLKIKSLKNSCIFKKFSYSDIIIDELLPSFTNITILSNFSNLTLNVPRDQSFAFDYSGSFTTFKDQKSIKLNEAIFDAGSNSLQMSGIYGKNLDTGKKIKIEASFGTVSLFER